MPDLKLQKGHLNVFRKFIFLSYIHKIGKEWKI